MTKNAGNSRLPFFESVLLSTLEDADSEDLREILGEDYVNDAEAAAMAKRIAGKLASERPELGAAFPPNVRMFPYSKIRKVFGPTQSTYVADVAHLPHQASATNAQTEYPAAAPPEAETLEELGHSSDETVRREVQHVQQLDKFIASCVGDYRRWATSRYFVLSLLTFLLFVVFAMVSSSSSFLLLSQAPLPSFLQKLQHWNSSWGFLINLSASLALGVFAAAVRTRSFSFWLGEVENQMAHVQTDIVAACQQNAQRLLDIHRQDAGIGPEYAKAWTTLLFWLGDRSQRLEVFMLQLSWHTEQTISRTSTLFMKLRAAVVGAAVLIPLLSSGAVLLAPFHEKALEGFAFLGVFLTATVWDAYHFSKTKNTFWNKPADRFPSSATEGMVWLRTVCGIMASLSPFWLPQDRIASLERRDGEKAPHTVHTN